VRQTKKRKTKKLLNTHILYFFISCKESVKSIDLGKSRGGGKKKKKEKGKGGTGKRALFNSDSRFSTVFLNIKPQRKKREGGQRGA